MYELSPIDYEKAINAGSESSYISIEDSIQELIDNLTPEEILIKKQTFKTISDEAKLVVELILKMPPNICEAVLCPGKQNQLSIQKIRKYVAIRLRWSRDEIDAVFNELKMYLRFA